MFTVNNENTTCVKEVKKISKIIYKAYLKDKTSIKLSYISTNGECDFRRIKKLLYIL